MFAKNKVSQSMIDAVNKIMSEKEVESKEEFLSEGWDEMLKSVKDKNKPQPSGGAGKKQGSRYGGSKQKEEPEEKEVKEELKGNQHKIDKNKNNKIDAEDFKMLRKEELKGNQHKIDANHNNKIDGQDFKILRGKKKVKEDTFAGKLLNSLSESEEIQKAINEVMKKDATAGDWIHDFVHSKNPKFAGKSTKERQKMALGAYYAKQNEEVEDLEQAEALIENFNIINEVSVGAKIRAYAQHKRDSFDHSDMGNDDESEHHDQKADKIMAHIEKHHGAEAAKHAHKLANSMVFGRHDIGSKTSPGKDSLQGGLRRNLDKGVTKSGKIGKSTQKAMKGSYMAKRTITGPKANLPEEVEDLAEKEGTGGSDPLANRQDYAKRHGTGQVYKKTHPGDKTGMTKSFAYDIKRSGPKGKLPEEVESLDEKDPCWTGYTQVGMKKKGGRDVPNCVPSKGVPKATGYKEEVEIDEAAPKKMDDVAKQNLTPAKKGVVGTVKSDFKNFKNFLAGKPETNEAVNPTNTTIDTLAGRSKKVPKEAKIDNGHSSAKVELKSEEVEQLDEDRWLMKYLLSKGINPEFVNRNQKVAHAKSNEFKKYRRDHQQIQGEEVQSEATSPIFRPKATDYNSATKARARRNTGLPFAGPYTKVSADPMQRARSMAQSAMQSVKDKQNQPTTMDKVKSAVDKTKKVATKTFMTAFKP
jgi:hypothetical protein